jgi:GNAT superfamily N-acetyltransferase
MRAMDLAEIARELDEFIERPQRNAWLYADHIHVYVRKARRLAPDKSMVATLDVANVEVEDGYRGEGIFTAFLRVASRTAHSHGMVIFVENVLNEQLALHLRESGRYVEDVCGSVPSFMEDLGER